MASTSCFTGPVHGQSKERITILLINPNSTASMTAACISTVEHSLPPDCTIVGFTAPHPAPSAIESATDAILSSEACIRALAAADAGSGALADVDAMLVACFSAHPLIAALRESYPCPVIGIMEASLYASRMLGGQFGIVATSQRSKLMQHDAVAGYGLGQFYVGSESTGLGVLDLERMGRRDVLERMGAASRRLVKDKGADCVLLGCAGMTDMVQACQIGITGRELPTESEHVNVIDGVEIGVHLLIALVRSRLGTSKAGIYKSSGESRKARGQKWL